MKTKESDIFPLWSFGYETPPIYDNKKKIVTSRGRTWQEAWECVQRISGCFLEPEKVRVLAIVPLQEKERYCETHRYDWLRDPPLWLKLQEGSLEKIW